MKKRIVALLLLAFAFSLFGCSEKHDPNCPAFLSEEKRAELEALYESKEEDISWYSKSRPSARFRYYGSFNGYDVVYYKYPPGPGFDMGLQNIQIDYNITIADYVFQNDSAVEIIAVKDGKTIALKEACEQGLITIEQVGEIYSLHEACWTGQ
ncbi:MAG: hypothetical protein IJO72_05355 [Oscillospiraceae bacterium]|nr:hypothetical protein [Oscillospiraceae bacterium]